MCSLWCILDVRWVRHRIPFFSCFLVNRFSCYFWLSSVKYWLIVFSKAVHLVWSLNYSNRFDMVCFLRWFLTISVHGVIGSLIFPFHFTPMIIVSLLCTHRMSNLLKIFPILSITLPVLKLLSLICFFDVFYLVCYNFNLIMTRLCICWLKGSGYDYLNFC